MRVERELVVQNQAGIHLRVASQIVKLLAHYTCDVEIAFNGRVANAKSIMSITQLLAPQGSKLHMVATGDDAPRAAAELEKLFTGKFGEE